MKKKVFLSIIITIFIELFIFNFGSVKSLFYKEIEYDLTNIKLEDVYYNEKNDIYHCLSSVSSLELSLNIKINNMYIDIRSIYNSELEIFIDYTDDANSTYDRFKDVNYIEFSHIIVKDLDRSRYINFNNLGNTHNIKISLKDKNSLSFVINNITFNKKVPVSINILRIIIIFMFTTYFIILRKKNIISNFINKHENIFFYLIIILFSILLIILYLNYSKTNINLADYYSTKYKDSLMNGKLELDFNMDLSDIDNIYDYSQRQNSIAFDSSYYNGKFYMYFSFLPALILGITNLSVTNLSLIMSIISTIFLSLLTKKIIENFYNNLSSDIKLLMIIFVLFNSRLLLLISRVRFYELIVICSFCFTTIGLYLFYLFKENNNKIYLLLGTINSSLSIICRPNTLFVALLGTFIIYKKINKKNILYYITPYILCALLLMYVNYIRFDNIFEFGIKYQLSIINNNYLKLNLSTFMNGIYSYLLKMPNIIIKFPFITNNISMVDYLGFYFNTSSGNGIIPMSVLGLTLPFIHKKVDKRQLKFILLSIIIGLIILTLDNTFGGSVKRYSLEFSYLFIIPITLLSIKAFLKNKKILTILVIISCLMNFFIIFDNKTDDLGNLPENNFYYKVKYFITPN